ncbi:WD domain, G-beta repeat protein, partial [Teladorsagia circumcincta]
MLCHEGCFTSAAPHSDFEEIAVSASSNEIHIFAWRNGDWVNTCTLSEHDLPVTGLDWAPNTNRIVSCSRDKNAFVWTFDKGVWKPELVL